MPSLPRLLLLAAATLLLLLMGSCVARNVAETAHAMREKQCGHLTEVGLGNVKVSDRDEAQGRADVHAVKAASVHARAA
jgi:hypothetical protein